MPIDTSIALQAKAPEFNPLQQALQVAQFRAYNANGLAAQQGLDANRAISAAYQQATDPTTGRVDNNKLMALIGGNPAAAFKLGDVVQSINTQKQQQQTLDRGDIALNNDQRNNYADSLKFLTQQFATVDPSDPKAQGKFLQIAGDAINQGHVNPAMVKATVAQMPDDPSQFKPWFQQKLASFQDVGAQLGSITPKPTQIDNNGSIQYKDTNPITNPSIVGATINKTLTPTEAASQVSVQKADGTTVTVPNATRLQQQGLGGLLPPNGQPQQATGNGRYGSSSTNPEFQTAPPAGVVDANQKANAAGGDMLVADQQSNANSGTRINILQNAGDALSKAQTGTGADKLNAVRGLVATLGGPADKVASYDEANKYLTQYAQQKAASFGHGTDSQLAAAIAGNGNTHISNLAAQDVVKVNLGLERMEQARMKAWESAGLQPSQYGQWKSQFGSTMDPRVFVADQMDPAKIQGMVKKMNPKEQATFRTQYNWAVQNGFINGPQ
jgi:hypothetical protein